MIDAIVTRNGERKGGRKFVRERTVSVNLTGINALLTFFCVKTCFHLNYRIFQRIECDLTADLKLCHYIKKGNKKKSTDTILSITL